jgi:hypothetical protein
VTRPERGPDFGFVRAWVARYWLGVWFAIVSGVWLYLAIRNGAVPGDDQYLVATRRWLSGIDPWATEYPGWFAAPPITLLPMIPYALLPFGRELLVLTAVVAGIATVRLLKRPWYWILFPPLVNGMIGGGIDTWLVPLILVGHGWLAVLAKTYAAVPLVILGKWRPLVVAGVILVVTAPILPWASYFSQFSEIQRHLAEQAANLSAPIYLVPVAVVALVLMGRARAAWLAVPALWPSTQWYYNSIALPGLTPVAAALMAVPSSWCVVAACVLLAIETRVRPVPVEPGLEAVPVRPWQGLRTALNRRHP